MPAAAVHLRRWSIPLAIVAASTAAACGGDALAPLLRYARAPIADGEWWRLLTGHLVHLGWPHFLLNALALLLIWALVGRCLRAQAWLLVLAVVIAGIDAGFWLLEPTLYWYVGLSGVLHGMLAAGLVAAWPRARAETLTVGTLLILKLAGEQLFGPLPGSEGLAGGPVVVDAHLYGAVAGTAIGGLLAMTGRGRAPL